MFLNEIPSVNECSTREGGITIILEFFQLIGCLVLVQWFPQLTRGVPVHQVQRKRLLWNFPLNRRMDMLKKGEKLIYRLIINYYLLRIDLCLSWGIISFMMEWLIVTMLAVLGKWSGRPVRKSIRPSNAITKAVNHIASAVDKAYTSESVKISSKRILQIFQQ